MNVASLVGTVAALAGVLGLVVVAAALFRRFAPRIARGKQAIPLEVVQRISVGAKQSLVVVRMGGKHVVVSAGEGGVRYITDVSESVAVEPAPDTAPAFSLQTAATQFRQALSSAMRVACVLIISGFVATSARAQANPPVQTPPAAAATQAAVPATQTDTTQKQQPATKQQTPQKTAASASRVDSMIARVAPQMQLSVGNDKAGGLKLSGTVGIVIMMGLMTMLPAVVLMMTGFTRILIVLNFLRQAIGAQSAPPAQLVAGLSLLLTLFVMAPTLERVNASAISPWMDGKITQTEMLSEAAKPFRTFMLRQTRQADLATFVRLSRSAPPARAEDVSLIVLTSAFVTSELRVAFQIGFALFLPFIVIDLVVAAVLMSMGMMMVPPAMISLPFKLLLFVLVDGWSLVIQGLVQSFR